MLRMLVLLSNLPTQVRAKLAGLVREIREDSTGAAMVEYSVLIGLITALVIAFVFGVGQWVQAAWNDLCQVLATAPINGVKGIC